MEMKASKGKCFELTIVTSNLDTYFFFNTYQKACNKLEEFNKTNHYKVQQVHIRQVPIPDPSRYEVG